MKKYRFGFDPGGLLLFLLMMLPNFVWFNLPAPDDILRRESITPVVDGIASVCQILFAAALCAVVNRDRERLRLSPFICASLCCGGLYAAGWVCYYAGFAGPPVVALLTLPPCLCFLFFALDRKNGIAVIPITVFTVCHLIYGIANFMI